MSEADTSFLDRKQRILDAVADACAKANRSENEITLIGVSKRQPDDRIEAALSAGQRVFGENQVQEAEARWGQRREGNPDLKLHFVGHLQSNKADAAVALFDAIHSLDRVSLAKALTRAIGQTGTRPDLFVQVNTGEEAQKSGVLVPDLPDFVKSLRDDHGLQPVGLMCLPPADEPAGPHFALLAKLADRFGLSKLSMGMSGDFETAIRLGATHIRIGSALFGDRPD